MRTIKATIEVREDSNLAALKLTTKNKQIEWEELTKREKIHLINALLGYWELYQRVFNETKDNENEEIK